MSRNYSSTAVDTTLKNGVSSSNTAIEVGATTGFPAAPFILAVNAGTASQELVLVTAVSGTTLTVTRGYDSTVAATHDAGAVVSHSHSGLDFRDSRNHEAATAAHGATGAVVGTTNTQTLTNKTLTTPVINGGNVAQGALGYAGVTANQGSITTAVDLTGLTVAVTAGTSRRLRITADVSLFGDTAGDQFELRIMEGATQLQGRTIRFDSANVNNPLHTHVVITPTAGDHTYKLMLARVAGTGAGTLGAAATTPASILVEDIGAA